MTKNLNECVQGETVRLVKVKCSGVLKKRLLEMGFIKDCTVQVVKHAPLRDPIELLIKNFHISLRISEASLIEVEPID